jgi:hypothetical protein
MIISSGQLQFEIVFRPVVSQFEVPLDFVTQGGRMRWNLRGLTALPRRRLLLPRGPAFGGDLLGSCERIPRPSAAVCERTLPGVSIASWSSRPLVARSF